MHHKSIIRAARPAGITRYLVRGLGRLCPQIVSGPEMRPQNVQKILKLSVSPGSRRISGS